MAKKKTPARRNPFAYELMRNGLYREKQAKSQREKEEQNDPFSRSAKHKKIELGESYWRDTIAVDHENQTVSDAETGEVLCAFRMEKKVTRNSLSELTGRIILDFGSDSHVVDSWDEAADYLGRMHQSSGLVTEELQCGDRVKVKKGPLKQELDRVEKERREAGEERESSDPYDEGVVQIPNGPATTVGITIDGQYHLVDESDLEVIFESFRDLREDDSFDDLVEFRFTQVQSGINIPISQEEEEILDICKNSVYKSSLDERGQEVARRMVSRGILNRRKDDDGKIYFTRNTKKLTRF